MMICDMRIIEMKIAKIKIVGWSVTTGHLH